MSRIRTGGRVTAIVAGLAGVVALVTVAAGTAGIGLAADDGGARASISRQVTGPRTSSGTTTLSAASTAELQALLATPGGRERLDTALQEVFGMYDAGVAGGTPVGEGGGVVQVLEYGVDGDHVWMKATVGDIAGGALRVACGRLGPMAPLCNALVDVIINWYENNNPTHGVWGEIFANGQARSARIRRAWIGRTGRWSYEVGVGERRCSAFIATTLPISATAVRMPS